MKMQSLWASVALLTALSSVSLWAQSSARTVTLPADSVLKVKMDDTIGSDRSKKGDRFRAIVDDRELPEGTEVIGYVTDVKKAGGSEGGKLAMEFRLLELPDGRRVKIVGVPASLDSKSVKTTSDGRMVATQSGKKNSGKYLAIGAGGGLLIGSMLGSNVAGALIGGAAGYFLGKDKDKKSKNKEVVVKEGTELGVRLDQKVAVNTGQVRPASTGG